MTPVLFCGGTFCVVLKGGQKEKHTLIGTYTVDSCKIHFAPLRNHGKQLPVGMCRELSERVSLVVQKFVLDPLYLNQRLL